MRSIFFSFWAVILPCHSFSQAMTPEVTNMAGFNATQRGSVVSISIGEPFITTLVSRRSILTQGYLQPEILPCVDVEFSYYPNPIQREFTVEAYGCDIKIQAMQLYSLWGQTLTTILPTKDNKFTLEGLSQGIYLLKVFLTSGESRTIKILKEAP